MFGKRCSRCESKVKKNHKFCPGCGLNLEKDYSQEDYGFLGKDDYVDEQTGFEDNFMEKMLYSAMRLLEKQMRNLNSENVNRASNRKNNFNPPGLNVQFFVNGKRVAPNAQDPTTNSSSNSQGFPKMSQEKIKSFAKLPRQEPKSKVKRIYDKIVYELIVPGVENIEDILINQLENSIEVKAYSKDVVYSKNLNVNLPILRYQLVNDSLVIEMQAR